MLQEKLENLAYASDNVQDAWKRILVKHVGNPLVDSRRNGSSHS